MALVRLPRPPGPQAKISPRQDRAKFKRATAWRRALWRAVDRTPRTPRAVDGMPRVRSPPPPALATTIKTRTSRKSTRARRPRRRRPRGLRPPPLPSTATSAPTSTSKRSTCLPCFASAGTATELPSPGSVPRSVPRHTPPPPGLSLYSAVVRVRAVGCDRSDSDLADFVQVPPLATSTCASARKCSGRGERSRALVSGQPLGTAPNRSEPLGSRRAVASARERSTAQNRSKPLGTAQPLASARERSTAQNRSRALGPNSGEWSPFRSPASARPTDRNRSKRFMT